TLFDPFQPTPGTDLYPLFPRISLLHNRPDLLQDLIPVDRFVAFFDNAGGLEHPLILRCQVIKIEDDRRAIRVLVGIDDARHYIERTEKSYDLIIFDVFKGEIPPAHLFSLECFEKARSKLNPEGFIIVNFNGFIKGDVGKAGRSLYKTLKAAGLEVHILL
ncbi:MAG: hypothetical protein IH819_03610, partial [Bacteroidetes bacterium]|nr:hypothetical protein [Bacteroidota bacterium]